MASSAAFHFDRLPSPVGMLIVGTDAQDRVRVLEFEDHEDRMHRLMRRQYVAGHAVEQGTISPGVRDALTAYFSGKLDALDLLETATGGTAFQRRVWAALRAIPAGTTESYGALAARIGMPSAVRAVGLANGANAIAIVVPCHRVIGANGSLTGFGGGLERKQWLLRHEGAAFRPMRLLVPDARLPGL